MRLPPALLVAVCAFALSLSACGESENDRYVDDFKPLNDKLLAIGNTLGAAIQGAESKRDDALAAQFDRIARQLRDLNADIKALDTPEDLKDEADALTARLDDATENVETIANAAGDNDARAAAAATVQLSGNANEVNQAQNKLARATGAAVGER